MPQVPCDLEQQEIMQDDKSDLGIENARLASFTAPNGSFQSPETPTPSVQLQNYTPQPTPLSPSLPREVQCEAPGKLGILRAVFRVISRVILRVRLNNMYKSTLEKSHCFISIKIPRYGAK